jgi:hypothetical protein
MTETGRLARLLASRLQAVSGAAAEITGLQRLPGGASRESWGVQARLAGGAPPSRGPPTEAELNEHASRRRCHGRR